MAKEKETNKREDFKSNLEKMFGKRSGIFVDNPKEIVIERFSTGSLKLDVALKGGFPKGKMTEVFGKWKSGKTSICIESVKQHMDKYPKEPVLWLDLEDVFDPVYFENIGVDVESDKFYLLTPKTGEQSYNAILEFLKTFKGGLIVIDSVPTLLPEKEDEAEVGDAQMALAARLNSQGVRKILPHMKKSGATIIFINQMRDNIGSMRGGAVTTGGKTIPYYCRTRIQMTGGNGQKGITTKTYIKIDKSNYGNEGYEFDTEIRYGEGFDYFGEVVDYGVELGIVKKSGSWFSYGETKIGQGKEAVVELLKDNPELVKEIDTKVREQYGI